MNNILAKRYAKALLSLGQEDGQYIKYGQELTEFSKTLESIGADSLVLFTPVFTKEVQSRVLTAILKVANLSPIVSNFLNLLSEKGRLDHLSAIVTAYRELVDEKDGLIRGTLTSVAPLNSNDLSAIKAALGIFVGRKVELTVTEDPSILGGLVAKLGDLVIDGSLKTQLNKLGNILASA